MLESYAEVKTTSYRAIAPFNRGMRVELISGKQLEKAMTCNQLMRLTGVNQNIKKINK